MLLCNEIINIKHFQSARRSNLLTQYFGTRRYLVMSHKTICYFINWSSKKKKKTHHRFQGRKEEDHTFFSNLCFSFYHMKKSMKIPQKKHCRLHEEKNFPDRKIRYEFYLKTNLHKQINFWNLTNFFTVGVGKGVVFFIILKYFKQLLPSKPRAIL